MCECDAYNIIAGMPCDHCHDEMVRDDDHEIETRFEREGGICRDAIS